MLNAIFRRLIPDWDQAGRPEVRRRLGALAGWTGCALNLLLFALKLATGALTGALSVTADAFNNLSDAASSLVTLAGFRLAGRRADMEHPFGHGRAEYLSGLIVALLILLVGLELVQSSLERILHPAPAGLTLPAAAILLVSALAKLAMGRFNAALGARTGSAALRSAALDARADALATCAVLAGLALSRWSGLLLDGYLGLAVALFILRSGYTALRDTLDPLLGMPPDPAEVAQIEALILRHPQILGIHDLVIHDYGPERRMMTVHAEVDAASPLLDIHAVVDRVERELTQRFRLDAVIHIDPVQVADPLTGRLRALTVRLAQDLAPSLTVHDLRAVPGPDGVELTFDVVAPYDVPLTDEELRARLSAALTAQDPTLRPVIGVDRSPVL